jgi:tRNA(fMet)-specific endonuclease VapC
VDADVILETTFLIDLERERQREDEGPAHRFLRAEPDRRLYVTFTVAGELACGPRVSERALWEEFLRPFRVLPWSLDVAWEYGLAYRHLAAEGRLIGTNDLWIAATALAAGMPVVTANADHYRRVPRLEVRTYRG